jgi:uncharacterized protein
VSRLTNPNVAMTDLQQLSSQSTVLLIYRDLLKDDAIQAFLKLLFGLSQPDTSALETLQVYSQWFYAVAETGSSWSDWLEQQIFNADNPFTQKAQHQGLSELPQALIHAARHDLSLLQRWSTESPGLIQAAVIAKTGIELPAVNEVASANLARSPLTQFSAWAEALPTLAQYHQQKGVGLFAKSNALRWRNGKLENIDCPEHIRLTDLVGYDWQQVALKQNTEALLVGSPALNVLLYGSRGSGKSALIKALMTEYGDRGLRLIELNKADMIHLADITEQLRTSVLKFIIFIDDLSFEDEEDSYKALKVVLEGSLTARPPNVAVYATSNRRHLIREFFEDRPRPSSADEVHAWDTVQEKLSLSDRFGLTLTFEPADQDTYLKIVRHLAQRYQLSLPDQDLTHQALQWAVRHNVRSGRTAQQFIDYLRGQKS